MTNDSTAISNKRDAPGARQAGAVAVNAARVLETTRRAWSKAPAVHLENGERRLSRASQSGERVVPRRFCWPSLVAALSYWSPKPL